MADYALDIMALKKPAGRTITEQLRQQAIEATGVLAAPLMEKQTLQTLGMDNGSGYMSRAMEDYLRFHELKHVRARAHHPQTTGKIERWHRNAKDEVTLVVHTSPDQLREAIAAFVVYSNQALS